MNLAASTVQVVLAGLARFTDAQRLYALELGGGAAGADLVVERWQGWDGLSSGFEWWVDALSLDAHLPLDDLLGQRATLWTRLADGSRCGRTGLVREAQCVGSDGGLARYRLCLVPWTWLLTQGRHSRVYQDKTVVQIVEAVFAAYAAKQVPLGGAPLATWRWGDEVGPFLASVRPRSYCVQYRETDAAFVNRLLAEEGLGSRLEENPDAPGGHQLLLFADSAQGPQDASAEAGGGIRFHRSDATESSDTIQAFGAVHRLESTALTLLSFDYKTMQAQTASLALRSGDDSAASLEIYDPVGAYAYADRSEAERHAGLIAQARAARANTWLGHGSVRSFRAGHWFALTQGPQLDDAAPREALLVAVHQAGVNNLPKTVREGVAQTLGNSDLTELSEAAPAAADHDVSHTAWRQVLARAEAVGYANHFRAVPREQAWRPPLADAAQQVLLADDTATLNPRPTAPGYQTAIVVGPDASTRAHGSAELHSDALGRIRVKFHFQQEVLGEEAADAAQQVPSRHSCWLRVAQRYAGPGVGSQFLPRIGQEVLVAFLEGDIDRPVVVGALYNGHGEAGIAPTPGGSGAPSDLAAYQQAGDHRSSAQANLAGGHAPAWHGMSPDADGHRNAAALLGIKSKEFGGAGHNALVFDDSDGQLRLQLATTHAATQLNLGHLIHQADNYRGSFRGEGFELRTDRWGAVRAQRGLWLSAYGLDGDTAAGDQVAATALLRQAAQLGEAFSDIAGTHQTVRLAAHEGVAQAGRSQLIDNQAPLRALLTSAKTLVAGNGFDDGVSDAPDRKPDAGQGRVPHSGDALLGLTAPAGIGFVAGQSLHWSAGETLTIASGHASNAALAGDLRLHAGQAIGCLANAVESKDAATTPALSLVTAQGKLEFEAQRDQLKLQSKDQLKIVSANAKVELAAGKTIHLATSGGASLTIEGGNIAIACPGTITVHAAKKSFVGPADINYPLPAFGESEFCLECFMRAAAAGAPLVPANGS
ncbi:type VI secretion system Vgr family protein [Lysobacter koreensis]|uniref:Type VI secretion system Vgr family protein n=1 Tax=Lysobacter koreensis TaxID=266122 RepID=A0ABW2YQ22_9GAMM